MKFMRRTTGYSLLHHKRLRSLETTKEITVFIFVNWNIRSTFIKYWKSWKDDRFRSSSP